MTAKELFEYLTQDAGFDEATSKAIMAAAGNEKVSKRAADFVQQKEYDALQSKAAELEMSYNGTKDKPGAKAYQEWYSKNAAAIQKLQTDVARYQERYGDLEDPSGNFNKGGKDGKPAGGGGTMTKEEIAATVREVISGGYDAQWSNLITGAGTILEKHLRSKRDTPIDWNKLGEIAKAKNGDLTAAYDEWDKPAAEAAAKAAQEAEIDRRVKEKLAQQQTNSFFPAGADASPSSVSPLSRAKSDQKYDRSKVVQAAVSGEYKPAVQ